MLDVSLQKVLLHAAEALTEAKHMDNLGIQVSVNGIDWKGVQSRKEAVTNQLVSGVTGLMKANKIRVIEGTASFASKTALEVVKKDGTKENIPFDKVILATGSVPAVPPIPGVKENAACVDSTALWHSIMYLKHCWLSAAVLSVWNWQQHIVVLVQR